jgi:hypothetical protein
MASLRRPQAPPPPPRSNDVLYAGDPSYVEQLAELASAVLAALEAELAVLDAAAKAGDAQGRASLMLVLPQLLPRLPPLLGFAPTLLPAIEAVCLRLKDLGAAQSAGSRSFHVHATQLPPSQSRSTQCLLRL